MKAEWASYSLDFKFLARTSRESMTSKETFFVRIYDSDGKCGVGECSLFRGLSAEDSPHYTQMLSEACDNVPSTPAISSIRFGFETAMINAGITHVAETPFINGEEGIPINGLVWMGSKEEMRMRIDEKLNAGFKVLKMKIGGIDFEREIELLKYVRGRYSPDSLELRLDANGSFSPTNAIERLKRLSDFSIHSIEQPIKAGQHAEMAHLCRVSPIDIALDEELIGMPEPSKIEKILDTIKPQYIILKPALCGGLSGADMWADEAERRGIGWWATSALESNIGLLAIARWTAMRGVTMPQGLGTGQLYNNNIPSGLELRGQYLYHNPGVTLTIPPLQWQH